MNDDELQFGELETTQPETALRPDRNKHYAVAALCEPQAGELPIFVDLDVMRDIERHAVSDTTVELGGVLLGAACHDADGKPFVVVTDSLRAKHFEATKGSFKFTHETWSEISREREQFPPELQMVGWYHTHPDWGVFLSGMDMFICNNFFNKPLDIALVVDPCRGDRGMFQWVPHGTKQTTHRTGGFYLVTSRFREDDLQQFTRFLAGDADMPDFNAPRNTSPGGQTVVHLHGQAPSWQGAAVMSMLTLQFCLLALIAWKMLGPDSDKPSLEKQVAKLIDERAAAERADTQRRTLDLVLGELKGKENGYTDELAKQVAENKRLQREAADQLELARTRANERDSLQAELSQEKKLVEIAEKDLSAAKTKRGESEKTVKELKQRLAKYEKSEDEKEAPAGFSTLMQWIVLGAVTVLFSGAIVAAFLYRKPEEADAPPPRSEAKPHVSAETHPEIDEPRYQDRPQ